MIAGLYHAMIDERGIATFLDYPTSLVVRVGERGDPRLYSVLGPEVEFSTRALSALDREGIRTLGYICEYTEQQFGRIRNTGSVTVREIKKILSLHGLCFAEE
jgi:hypothetical protein